MIVDSVNYARAEGKRVIYDAEHFFDAWRDDRGYALECLRAAAAAGAENVTLCDTNGSSLPGQVAEATAAVVADARRAGRGRHPHPQRRRVRGRQLARRGRGRARGWSRGRSTATASAAATPTWSRSCPRCSSSSATSACRADRMRLLTETAHFVDELTNTTPDPDQPYVGRNAFAHKGGMHVAGVQADARTFEHLDPKLVGNSRDVLISELSGQGLGAVARRERRHRPRRRRGQARGRAVKEREHRGYHYEAADASFELLLRREAGDYEPLFRLEGFRVITEKRADGQVETRGDDQDLGRRPPLRAHGGGQRPRQRAGQGAARRDQRAPPAPRRHRADQLQGPHPRRRTTAPARSRGSCSTRPTATRVWGSIGVSENIIEASWEALVDSLEYAFQPEPAVGADGRA